MKKILSLSLQVAVYIRYKISQTVKAGYSILATKYTIGVVFMFFCSNSITGQNMQGASEPGIIILSKGMPKLELRILDNENISSEIYPGMRSSLSLLIKNNGRVTAKECQLIVESDNPLFTTGIPERYLFDLEPGDSIIKSIEIQTDRDAQPGVALLTFLINEKNGYNLFPARVVNFEIKETPPTRVVVTDFAVRDQSGIGYFEQFEDVQLFFRVHNCGSQPIENVSARIELKPGVIARQLNPNFALGTLQPGQYRDINATVSTGMVSDDISLDIHLSHESNTSVQSFQLNFRQDYKTPNDLLLDNCNQLVASRSSDDSEIDPEDQLPARSSQSGKYAIIIVNKDHFSLDSIEYALKDADLFRSVLNTQLGFREENIITIQNITHHSFALLKDNDRFNAWKRNWRRAKEPVELVFYYIGYCAVDNSNGDVYLLPVNFSALHFQSRINVMDVYKWLSDWKEQYKLKHVSVFMNLQIHEKSKWGQRHADDFKVVKAHYDLPGFSSLISSSFQQSSLPSGTGQLSLFTEAISKAVNGAADFNRDKFITLSELHRFISDELQGIPAGAWNLHNSYSTPVFFGEDHVFY